MTPAHLALAAAAALLLCVRADSLRDDAVLNATVHKDRQLRSYELPTSCLYDGRWHDDGDVVTTREECMRCVCMHGALSCRRRACASMPNPLPRRCHLRHRRGACCPELHCPDGVKVMEHGAAARFESEDLPEQDVIMPSSANHACVEGGTVFAAGSALLSNVACEQCFCLRGVRRCVRPTCLPQPQHCAPRPAPGACCPQRYYCDRTVEGPDQHKYDCKDKNTWVSEGESVSGRGNCSACFCLRGQVHCQALRCAPPLAGCRPLLAPGECCAHQYVCDRPAPVSIVYRRQPPKEDIPTRFNERAFHSSKTRKIESTTKKILISLYTQHQTSLSLATQNLITTTKVKRKTEEPFNYKPEQNISSTISNNITTTQNPVTVAKLIAKPEETSKIEATTEKTAKQPEGTVKIVINGTINCTAELSSKVKIPLTVSINNTYNIPMEALPRVPIVNVEAQTYSPNDIITDRNINGGFDENDTFTINVTSSLMTNTSHSTSRPAMTVSKVPEIDQLVEALNGSKKTKGDYDYDYTEPTLPPSLPNLKIIPFVAADAVVDNEPAKETLTYPVLEREDKYPVYYPASDTKIAAYPTRREDTYQPTQYPIFIVGKDETPNTPMSHDGDLTGNRFPEQNNLGVHEYTVSTSLGSHMSDIKPVTTSPTTSTTFTVETPAVNLFSPPVETEGGFIPKGPSVNDEYYSAYPITPGPNVPHLTTSMQLDITKGMQACIAKDGRRVRQGDSILMGCLTCTCTWVELSCKPILCSAAPLGCERLPLSSNSYDACCGDIVCPVNNTTPAPVKKVNKVNETKVEVKNETHKYTEAKNQMNNTGTGIINKVNIEKETAENITKPLIPKTEFVATTTTVAPTVTEQPIEKIPSTTTRDSTKLNDSHEYDDDDEDEDEFSFGSVLKLLLSDSYESTTSAPIKKPATRPLTRLTPPTPTSPEIPSTEIPFAEIPSTEIPFPEIPSTVAPFIPLPPNPYAPSAISLNTVNRIDHLILGEATAIKRTTMRPITNKTTKTPIKTTIDIKPESDYPVPFTSVAHEGPRPPNIGGLPGIGAGLLKLAGCNIYGRMYRVGRIIAELSTPCQECWCTEIGVQCKPLFC